MAKSRFFVVFLAAGLIILFLTLLIVGRFAITVADLGSMLDAFFSGRAVAGDLVTKQLVFWWIRLPRTLMAILVGMGLSVSGAVYQALFRNPLVSPDILGVAAGCTFGAALGLVLPGQNYSLIPLLSLSFGLLAVTMTVVIARLISVKPVIVLVLAGMVILSFFNALLMVLKYFSDPYEELPSIVFWIMGSLSRVTWHDLMILAPTVVIGLIFFMAMRFRLNILSLGDIQAKSLGLNPSLFRLVLIFISSLIVALTVASCGQICWIGLIIPHMARTLVGPDHQRMLPVTALLGAIFLLGADGLARSLSTAEIPVGIITALSGAPIFAFLLYKNRGSGWV